MWLKREVEEGFEVIKDFNDKEDEYFNGIEGDSDGIEEGDSDKWLKREIAVKLLESVIEMKIIALMQNLSWY